MPAPHLVALTRSGGLFHTLRHADGTWERFGYLKGLTGDPGFITDVALTTVDRDLHVLATTNRGRLHHAIRWATARGAASTTSPRTGAASRARCTCSRTPWTGCAT
jgi:hypothetical protein